MAKNIVIVESPAKAKTIGKFLGKSFAITASFGHVRDLPNKKLGVDIKNNFEPTYSNLKDKSKVISEIKGLCKNANEIYIATDPDREGEAIAWHITNALKLKKNYKRIVFNEITESAVKQAIADSRDIDTKLVDAQQARRILDRLIGYKLSPILSKKIRKGLSAGRVQSVAVKIICDREKEIQAFIPQEYWLIDVDLEQESPITVQLFAKDDPKQKLEIANEKEATEHSDALKKSTYGIHHIKKTKVNRNAPVPFITSTLQQEAARKLNWTAKRTMAVAQQLYEGINVDGEHIGLITYMRTDSTRLSDEAKAAAKQQILNDYGTDYLSNKTKKEKKKSGVQDAHEAIRPSYADKKPSVLKSALKDDQFKLYQLIWNRFMASQMANQIVEQTQILVKASGSGTDYFLKATGQVILFDGFTRVYEESKDAKADESGKKILPKLDESKPLDFKALHAEQKFTQPPARFTEASLVKELEEQGIGRPSTYAPTIGTIQDRGYIDKQGKSLLPSELGMTVNNQLEKFFKDVIDVHFTSDMETKLDEIMDGKHQWQEIVNTFYSPFSDMLENANKNMESLKKVIETDQVCEKCDSMMVIKEGRFGNFLACSNFPKCKNTKSLAEELGVDCPECGEKLVEKRSRKGKVFYGCSGFPKCKFAAWDKPVKEECPKCNAPFMLQKTKRNGDITLYCHECDKKSEDKQSKKDS